MKRNLFIANWKMNKTVDETIRTIAELKALLSGKFDSEIAIAPPFTSLHPAMVALQETNMSLAAQNVYHEEKGAFTGEISPLMLKELSVKYVIVGHSERRQYFRETDELVLRKVKKLLEFDLIPVLCIGETKKERDSGKTFAVLESQLKGSLKGVELTEGRSIVIAYEPVWAIGTGDTATPETAEEAHSFIREMLGNITKRSLAHNTIILYGGSVKPDNIQALIEKKNINGALVGGASLDAKSFSKIVRYFEE